MWSVNPHTFFVEFGVDAKGRKVVKQVGIVQFFSRRMDFKLGLQTCG